MMDQNLNIVDKFFDAYSRHDDNGIQQVLSQNVTWLFPGQNPLSGTKAGIKEVVAFFDEMGGIMGKSNVKVERLVMGEDRNYLFECQHIQTNREDDTNLNQDMCVLWKFEDRKIIEGKHFMSDQFEADNFFNKVFQE